MGKVLVETRGDVQEGIDTAFYAASEGIGYAISRFGDTYRLPEMFAAIFLLMIAAVALTEGMRKLESVLAPWKTTQETR